MSQSAKLDRRAVRNIKRANRKTPGFSAPETPPLDVKPTPALVTEWIIQPNPQPVELNAAPTPSSVQPSPTPIPVKTNWWTQTRKKIAVNVGLAALLTGAATFMAMHDKNRMATQADEPHDAVQTMVQTVAHKAVQPTRTVTFHHAKAALVARPVAADEALTSAAVSAPAVVTPTVAEPVRTVVAPPVVESYETVFAEHHKHTRQAFADRNNIQKVDAIFEHEGRLALTLSRDDLKTLLTLFDRVPDNYTTMTQREINSLATEMVVKSIKASKATDVVTRDDVNGLLNMETVVVTPDGNAEIMPIGSVLANARSANPLDLKIEDDIKEAYASATPAKLKAILAATKVTITRDSTAQNDTSYDMAADHAEYTRQKYTFDHVVEAAQQRLAVLDSTLQQELQVTGDSMMVTQPDGSTVRAMRSPMSPAQLDKMPDIGATDEKAEHYYQATYTVTPAATQLPQQVSATPYTVTAPIFSSDVIAMFVAKRDRKGAKNFWNDMHDTHLTKKQAFREMVEINTREETKRHNGEWTYFTGKPTPTASQPNTTVSLATPAP